MKIKKILASVLGLALTASVFAGCSSGSGSTAESGSSGSGSGSASVDLIKVGIINNDPNESGYRTANDKDMKATFTEENGYDASFAYSLKNDEQIAAFQRECDEQYGENAALNPNNIIESKKFEITTPEVKISIAPENSYMIEARVINGRKYLLIPADDGVEVNGIGVNIPGLAKDE